MCVAESDEQVIVTARDVDGGGTKFGAVEDEEGDETEEAITEDAVGDESQKAHQIRAEMLPASLEGFSI